MRERKPSPTPIIWPHRGLTEALPGASHPSEFSREEKNVRTQMADTRKLQGGRRAGLSKLIAGSTGAGKVMDIGRITRQQRSITYSPKENYPSTTAITDTVDWRKATPDNASVYDLAVDGQNNVYAINGKTGFAKFSASGELIATATVIAKDDKHVPRAIAVDDYGKVFMAVTEGGNMDTAAIWGWRPDLDANDETVYTLLFELQPGAFIGELEVFDDKLYVALNNSDLEQSAVVVYEAINTATPIVSRLWEAPYPLHGLVVQESGAVVVCSPPQTNRWKNPNTKGSSRRLVGDTPQDFEDNGDIKIWAWWDAYRVDEGDLLDDVNPRLFYWRDQSRKGAKRDWLVNETASIALTAPHYHRRSPLNQQPGIFFGDGSSDEYKNGMRTHPNAGISLQQADQQRTAFPMYEGAQFCVFMVVTPQLAGADDDGGAPNPIIAQSITNELGRTDGQARDFWIAVNQASGDTAGTFDAGRVAVRDEDNASDLWSGTGSNPRDLRFDEYTGSSAPSPANITPSAVLITFFCDGNLDKGGSIKSFYRVNGVPVDRAESRPLESRTPTELGFSDIFDATNFPNCWIHEILVLDRYDRDDDASGCFSDHASGVTAGYAYKWPDDTYDSASDTILEKIEAYLARKWGMGSVLDQGNSYYEVGDGTAVSSTYNHAYSDSRIAGRFVPWSGSASADPNDLATDNAIVAKYSASTGKAAWIAGDVDGAGYGLALYPKVQDARGQDVLTCGPRTTSVDARRIYDDGDGYALTGSGSFTAQLAGGIGAEFSPYQRLVVDEDQNGYLPMDPTSTTNAQTLWIIDSTGSDVIKYLTGATAAASQPAYAVAIPHEFPDYGNDLAGAGDRAEKVFLGCDRDFVTPTGSYVGALVRLDLVTPTHNTDAPRTTEVLVVNNGDIKYRNASAWTTVPTGGSGALSSSARFVSAVTLLGKRYYTDGVSYKLYDPLAGSGTVGQVLAWEAKKGEIPPHCQVVTAYRGRIVLFGDPSDAHNWHMSAKDDPTDWDTDPPRRTSSQAVSGNNPELAGRIPSVINCFAPLTDDIGIVGTDQSIHRLVGDPVGASGQVDLVTQGIGIAYGEAWAQDPEGTFYAFMSKGGVLAIAPPYDRGSVRQISLNRIESRLEDIDFSAYYVRLAWNVQDDGLHVFLMPFAQTGGAIVQHYFWERRLDAWHIDEFNAQSLQPTAVAVLDGDAANDRRLVLGCEDSYVRLWDEDATDDDGTRMDSYAVWELEADGAIYGFERRFSGFEITLARDLQGAKFGIATRDDVETPAVSEFTFFDLSAGRNPRILERFVGNRAFVRIGSTVAGDRFAFEEGIFYSSRAGRTIPR